MDSNSAIIFSAILGGLIGGPIGYLIERTFTRPRLKIEYSDARYEDIISLPLDLQQKLTQYSGFVKFIESQIKWQFIQRLTGNLFNKQELNLVRELAIQWSDRENLKKQTLERDKNSLQNNSLTDADRILTDWLIDYRNSYDNTTYIDYKQDPEETLKRIFSLINKSIQTTDEFIDTLKKFINYSEKILLQKKNKSDRLIFRIGISNNGLQDGVIRTEATLELKKKKYRLPLFVTSRPWEILDSNELSQYIVLNSRSYKVIDFIVDSRLNAPVDLEKLKDQLHIGCKVKLNVKGINNKTVGKHKFIAQLIE